MNACPCPCQPEKEANLPAAEQDSGPRMQRGLFNRITVILLLGWVLIVGSIAERATPAEEQLTSIEFIESMLR